jgi:hypothetical protein
MAGSNNTTSIDSVVDPVAVEQFNALKKAGERLRAELVKDLEAAIALSEVFGGSTPANFTKNLKAAQDANEKLIASDNKVLENKVKVEAKKEEIYNKYLIQLSKQEAARQQADAKEIAEAEKKATKLAAIQAEAARKASVQFPAGSSLGGNPVTQEPTNPTPSHELIITGNENMAITATKSAEATTAQSLALAEQKDVIDSLSVSQRANFEMLLALKSEQALNAAELKELNVQDAASGERAVFLTAEQLKLKLAISEVTVELNRQAKQMLAAGTSVNELQVSLDLLRTTYYGLTEAERNTTGGQAMLVNINQLDASVKKLKGSTGDTSKEVGAYEKAIARATSGTQLATQAITIATRTIVRMVVQFALFAVAFKAVEMLYEYIKALDMFNPVATEATRRQDALTQAFASTEYTKAIEGIDKLGITLKLAKENVIDSDTAVNQYNETLGKATGYVDSLKEAQQRFIDIAPTYIDMVTKEAAAQLILSENAKLAAENEVKNQKLRTEIEREKAGGGTVLGVVLPNKKLSASEKAFIKRGTDDMEAEIKKNDKRLLEARKNGDDAATSLIKQGLEDRKKLGLTSGGDGSGTAQDAIATLKNSIANKELERQKIVSQNLINNDKLSYSTRIRATNDFYEASKQIAENNERLATTNVKLSADQKQSIELDLTNKLTELQITRNNQLKTLRDKQYKQDQQILKNDIETQRNAAKAITDDPNIGYEAKLGAEEIYYNRSQELIKANYNEQIKEAGKNAESIKIAEQNKQNSLDELGIEYSKKRIDLRKEELQKLITTDKEAQQEQLEDLNQGAIVANQVLQNQHDKALDLLNDRYDKGLITEKEYNRAILAENDDYAIKRLKAELVVQEAILAIKTATRDKELSETKAKGATPAELAKIKGGANKSIDTTGNTIASVTGQLTEAEIKAKRDGTTDTKKTADEKKQEIVDGLKEVSGLIGDTSDLSNSLYDAEISKLEKKGKLIRENAQIESDAINNSLDTQANKARRQQILDAQTASQQKAINAQIASEKTKQARADKVAAIAEIILNTAIAATKVTAQAGLLGLLTGVPAVIALGAISLAKVIATPIPQFAKGTPIGGHKGGYAIVGDGGGPERITEPGKMAYYSPSVATMVDLPRGTVVEPYTMLPKTPKWESNGTGAAQVVNVKIDQPKQKQPRLMGWVEAQRQADSWGRYSGNYFK